ncbi:unnamed protein product [Prorocentrum cordatum]|uniref:peptidylprolyl isomerase n=1 Tax=Prorocentrum cordatum TaxID=2364126 RepID=A0ABN9WFJ5_9DINO|nr:unnamed protein product [Polarella glacialis]
MAGAVCEEWPGAARTAAGGQAGAALPGRARAREGFVETPSGLQYRSWGSEGSGDQPKKGQLVAADYTGWLEDFESEAKFDSSRDRRRPLEFPVGTGKVIKAWDEALLGMKVGERRLIVVPPAIGYGNKAVGPIPPGSTLYFDVELVRIGKRPPAEMQQLAVPSRCPASPSAPWQRPAPARWRPPPPATDVVPGGRGRSWAEPPGALAAASRCRVAALAAASGALVAGRRALLEIGGLCCRGAARGCRSPAAPRALVAAVLPGAGPLRRGGVREGRRGVGGLAQAGGRPLRGGQHRGVRRRQGPRRPGRAALPEGRGRDGGAEEPVPGGAPGPRCARGAWAPGGRRRPRRGRRAGHPQRPPGAARHPRKRRLLEERRQGSSSRHAAYIGTLPDPPLMHPLAEPWPRGLADTSPLLSRFYRTVMERDDALLELLGECEPVWKKRRWALGAVWTRAFELPAGGGGRSIAMLPLLDLMNHWTPAAAEDRLWTCRYEERGQSIAMVADRGIAADEELDFLYDNSSDGVLLAQYGIAVEEPGLNPANQAGVAVAPDTVCCAPDGPQGAAEPTSCPRAPPRCSGRAGPA